MKLECLCLLLAAMYAEAFRASHPYGGYGGHGELYNPEKEKCCRGVAFPKTRSSYMLCCGNTTYDITEEICCQGTAVPLSAGTRTACCGRKTYDVKASLCCMGKEAKLPSSSKPEDLEHFECRGSKAVDTRETAQNEVVPSSSSKRVAYGGYGGFSRPSYHPYPPNPRPYISSWCNGVKFNTTTHMCCNTTIKESTKPNSACCGEDQQYDKKKQVCCKNPDDGSWKLSPKPPTTGTNYRYYYPGMEDRCCGGVGYDSSTQMCCKEKLHTITAGRSRWEYQCCGSDMIDSSTHTCCDGENAMEKKSDGENCCGNLTYTHHNQLCCWFKSTTQVFDKTGKGYGSQCCAGGMYNTKTHLCCYNYEAEDGNYETLIEKTAPNSQCCGKVTYDPAKEFCCGNTKTAMEEGKTSPQCCGKEVYNPDNQMCCDQKVLEITDQSRQSCCSIYQSDDYMTGCFGMNRPHHPGYYEPTLYDAGMTIQAGDAKGEDDGETTPAPEPEEEPTTAAE